MQSNFLQLIVSICCETIKYNKNRSLKFEIFALPVISPNSAILLVNHLGSQNYGGAGGGAKSDQGWGCIVLTR